MTIGRRLLEQLLGDESATSVANRMGISLAHVSKTMSGQREGGKAFIAGLLRAYPERREEILAAYFPPEKGEQG